MAERSLVKRVSFAAIAAASIMLLAACSPVPDWPIKNFQGVPTFEHDVPDGVESDIDSVGDGPEEPEPEVEAEQRDIAAEVMDGPVGVWLENGSRLAIVIGGSSTCPVVGTKIHVVESESTGNTVRIETAPLPDGPCTMDFVPHTTVFWTQMEMSTTEPLTVHVLDQEFTVPVK